MNVTTTTEDATAVSAETIVLGAFSDSLDELKSGAVNEKIGGTIGRLIEENRFKGKLNETVCIQVVVGIAAKDVVLVGLGKKGDWSPKSAYQGAGSAARKIAAEKVSKVAFYFPEGNLADAVCGAMTGCVGQDIFKAEKDLNPFDEIIFASEDTADLQKGMVLGESVNLTRRVVNLPPNALYPGSFLKIIEETSVAANFEIEVWDRAKLETEGCGALLQVAIGSERPPFLVIMRYNGGGNEKPIALVGKGVTFDSGGLSLKPSASMIAMKCDMTGAGTVLGTMNAIAKLKPKVNVIGVVGLVENLINGHAYKLGDVLHARNGKTIEVHNTDAEGRLVLADALDVANSEGARKIIDLATLTGACMVAVGSEMAGIMTNDQEFCDSVKSAISDCGERAWQLPMDEDFLDQIKGKVGDLKNVSGNRYGGASIGGKFLEQFVGETPWVHIDLGGPIFLDKPKPWMDAGATGAYLRSLYQFVANQ